MRSFFEEIQGRWPAGREDYHWHILFPEQLVSARLVEPYRGLTHDRSQVAAVPAKWVHLTVLHSGPVDQISPEEITQITGLVRGQAATQARFDAVLDRPSIGRVAVECIARPGPPARRLWTITSEATAAVTGNRFPVIPAVYYPHVSLAYGKSRELHQTGDDEQRRAMKRWLSDDAVTGPVTLPVTTLSLVAQSHDRHHITWRHITGIPLGGQPTRTVQHGRSMNIVTGGAQVGSLIQAGDIIGDLNF